jgi:hypothetical protein
MAASPVVRALYLLVYAALVAAYFAVLAPFLVALGRALAPGTYAPEAPAAWLWGPLALGGLWFAYRLFARALARARPSYGEHALFLAALFAAGLARFLVPAPRAPAPGAERAEVVRAMQAAQDRAEQIFAETKKYPADPAPLDENVRALGVSGYRRFGLRRVLRVGPGRDISYAVSEDLLSYRLVARAAGDEIVASGRSGFRVRPGGDERIPDYPQPRER